MSVAVAKGEEKAKKMLLKALIEVLVIEFVAILLILKYLERIWDIFIFFVVLAIGIFVATFLISLIEEE